MYKDIKHKIYFQQSKDFINLIFPNYFFLLKKVFYSISINKEFHYLVLNSSMLNFYPYEFFLIHADFNIYEKKKFILAIYIDNLLLLRASKSDMDNIKNFLPNRFCIVNFFSPTYFLRMTITQNCI